MRDAHERHEAVEVPKPPERAVSRVEDEIADACVAQQHALLARRDINLHDVAIGVIVGRVPSGVGGGIVSERRDAVEHRALDVCQMANVATGAREHAEVPDDARIAERADQIATAWIDERARD